MSAWILPLLAVVGCQPHPDSKPGDSTGKESPPVDTGASDSDSGRVDSVDTGDSEDTGETGDTRHTGDTPETGDTSTEPPPCDRSLAWKYVAAGWYSTCGIHTDGCAECWGVGRTEDHPDWDTGAYQYQGEDRPPPGDYVALEMIVSSPFDGWGQHACGILSSGEAVCWGEDTYGETIPPVGDYQDVGLWSRGSLAVGRDGTLAAWGAEFAYSGDDYVKVSVGSYYGYGLEASGVLVGRSADGAVGYGAPAGTFVDVDVEDYACGVQTDGSLLCWDPDAPADTEGDYLNGLAPVGVFERVCLAHQGIACALDVDGAIQCWGAEPEINAVPEGYTFTQVACGKFHVCGLTTDGQIICWGYDYYGETTAPS